MTGQELQNIRKKLNLTIPNFAKLLNTPVGTVEHYLYNTRPIPGVVALVVQFITEEQNGKVSRKST